MYDNKYTSKYREFLKIEFPRVPYPSNPEEFFKRAHLGSCLRKIHCMENVDISADIEFFGRPETAVEKVAWKKDSVYIGKKTYFTGITQDTWSYFIGGYQPLQKWLKDRKGQIVTEEDIITFKKIASIIKETKKLCDEISRL